ncbi:MAG TPA: hypothetical protein VF746_09875 [Longimicrobium sp.]|jgi:hypothetical protein
MKKLNLKLDELAVESFPTTIEPVVERGTVHGAMATRTGNCATCNGPSCYTSCRAEDGLIYDQQCTCPVGTV